MNKISKDDLERFRDANGFLDFARVEKAVNALRREDSLTASTKDELIQQAEKIIQRVDQTRVDTTAGTRDPVTIQPVNEKPAVKDTYFGIPVKTAEEKFRDTINRDKNLQDYIVKAVDSKGKLDFEKLDQRVLEKLRDANTGLLDIDRLKRTAEDLAKKERLRVIAGAISGRPAVDEKTGRIDKISETLARDSRAKEELLNAVDEDGNLDFAKIPQEDLNKFRDAATG